MTQLDHDATERRPLRADAARNRQLLLDAALTAFRRDGVNASLDDIARAAGVGSGTLYRHFSTRDALVLAVIDKQLAALADLGAELLDHDSPLAAVEQWLAAYIDHAGTFQGLAGTLVSTPPEDRASTQCHLTRAAGTRLIERAVAAGELHPNTEPEDLLDMVAAIAWIGEHGPPNPDRPTRLLHLLLAGSRP